MTATFEQITSIVLNNPNKGLIDHAREHNEKLSLHLYGKGMDSALKHSTYFENKDIYDQRKCSAMSNKDLFGRLLQQEDMVFTARGGSSHFSLPDSDEEKMNILLDDVRFEMSLRKWIRNFALQAYRSDPMGVIFMEVEPLGDLSRQPKAYPTYKSSQTIFDYLPRGRRLEYICFQLSVSEARSFGVQDPELKEMKGSEKSTYFRFVDDIKDVIVQKKDSTVILVTNITQRNPLPNEWNRTPAFIVSDLIQHDNEGCFVSPLMPVIELADCFLNDRSVRDLQKKYHGFAKAVEPLLQCATCQGDGVVKGQACPDCTVPGAEKGTGYKTKTKVSDVTRFPLETLKELGSFSFESIFGYVTPPIEAWEKQDRSLDDLEELMEMTYWGTIRMKRPQPGNEGDATTATEVRSNDQPKEARLNMTADWAEKTENMIADFIGEYWFDGFKKSSIAYGRDYILKSADEYQTIYQDLRTKGAPDSALDMAYKRWKQAEFKNNPIQLVIEMKKFLVEPFPHIKASESKGIISDFGELNRKLYFGEWASTIPDAKWASPAVTPEKLRGELKAYVDAKGLKEPEPAKPVFN